MAGLEDGTLCGALNLIFTNPRLFGAGVFSLAANLLCDVMNHEPTCYPKLDAQGVPKAFLDAWERDDPGRFRRRIRSAASRTPEALSPVARRAGTGQGVHGVERSCDRIYHAWLSARGAGDVVGHWWEP